MPRLRNFATSKVLEAAESMVSDLEEMDSVKANKPTAIPVTIPIAGWNKDSTAEYPNYYDIAAKG